MENNTTALAVFNDDTGYQYDLSKIPDKNAPLIQTASQEILQEMQVNSIIQNLENVSRLMFVAYNALSGTNMQSRMSNLQKTYLSLMDDSSQTITTFKNKSEEICHLVIRAYDWLIKGKESMALLQFNKCAADAAAMAEEAEKLADGFSQLSDQAEEVLEKSQDYQALQYQKMDELKAKMDEYNANLKRCESLRDSLEEDIKSVNQAYEDARKKEQSAFDMKKGLMITQIVTSCIGAIIPSVSSVKNSGDSNSKAAQQAQTTLEQKQQEKDQLTDAQKSQQTQLDQLNEKKQTLEKEKQEIQEKIHVEESVTARDPAEKEANLTEYRKQLAEKETQIQELDQKIEQTTSELNDTGSQIDQITSSIDNLNKQLSAYADQCRDDLQRAEEAAEKALEKKLEMEKQRRETLASIQEFTMMIQSSVSQKNTAETAVKTLQTAIGCIKQVVVSLTTAAKFWRSMEAYCQTLCDSSLGNEIKELSQGLSLEERLEYYQESDFMMAFLVYICRWAALFYVCDDYKRRNDTVRKMVADNILSSASREEEWEKAGELAAEMGQAIQSQVDDSNRMINALASEV